MIAGIGLNLKRLVYLVRLQILTYFEEYKDLSFWSTAERQSFIIILYQIEMKFEKAQLIYGK